MKMRTLGCLTLATVMSVALARSSEAIYTYSFDNITAAASRIDAADQVFVDVTGSDGRGEVSFLFYTVAGDIGKITQISFNDSAVPGVLYAPMKIINGSGVSFLPGGNATISKELDFDKPYDFSAERASGRGSDKSPLDIGVGETLTIQFQATSLQSVINALNSQDLRIGLHIQSLRGGGSQKAINSVPDGGSTIVLMGMVLMGVAFMKGKLAN